MTQHERHARKKQMELWNSIVEMARGYFPHASQEDLYKGVQVSMRQAIRLANERKG